MAKNLYDEFKIIQKKDLSSDDIYSLTYLYMPLLGIDSFALYIGLSTFDINTPYNYKKLIDLLSLKTLQSVNSAINKLEGIGLIKEYVNSENTIYQINRPLAVLEFIEDEALRVLLENEIGTDAVLLLLEKNNINRKPVGYKEVTKNFSDVFEISTETEDKVIEDVLGIKKDDLNIDNKEFNYIYFENLFDTNFIPEEVLNDNEFKRNIIRLSKVYKLDEKQMVNCVMKSIDLDKDMSYSTLAKNAKLIFRDEYKVQNPRLVSSENDSFMDSAKDDEMIALSERLESMSFADVLEYLSGAKAAESELAMFDQLDSDFSLTTGAINVMIMMVSKEKEGVLPGLTYFQKIASTWQRAKVKNAYDALMFTQRENEKKKNKNNKTVTGKSEIKTPAWYEEYIKQVDKASEDKNDDTLNETANNAIIDAAKELFGDN